MLYLTTFRLLDIISYNMSDFHIWKCLCKSSKAKMIDQLPRHCTFHRHHIVLVPTFIRSFHIKKTKINRWELSLANNECDIVWWSKYLIKIVCLDVFLKFNHWDITEDKTPFYWFYSHWWWTLFLNFASIIHVNFMVSLHRWKLCCSFSFFVYY